jgi:hypothetical protein
MPESLSQEVVADIRERHDYLRQVDQEAPEAERLKPSELDEKVAQEYSVSRTSVLNIVMGLTHVEAGGPIDRERRSRRDLFIRERANLGAAEARRRLQLRARGLPIVAAKASVPVVSEALALRITVMDSRSKPTVATVTLAPGEWLKTDLVAASVADDVRPDEGELTDA